MDWDDAPGALHAELLEEGGGDYGVGGGISIRVEESAADYGHDDYGEAAAEDLRCCGELVVGGRREGWNEQ